MPLNIRNEEVNELATKLAARKHITKTEAVRLALERELQLTDKEVPLLERIKIIQDRLAAYPDTGFKADKAFYDELSGDY
ncbi:type II toxin-antitoxin system VapB family antitoxin [Phyllobacterium sp. LjRoot231]|uniref:type II toxin-antitoxin system VapB family antitoxin n=1 Tax=Phyllobacterium sp. LjRoot231 TaxID=3342289 RepID=UPI003ED07DB7